MATGQSFLVEAEGGQGSAGVDGGKEGGGKRRGRSEKCHMCASSSATASIFSLAPAESWRIDWTGGRPASQSLTAATPMRHNNNKKSQSSSIIARGGISIRGGRVEG